MSSQNLYEETTPTTEPLYTTQDMVPAVDSTVGNYSVLKSITNIATGETPPDEINFNTHVDETWKKTVPEQNRMDVVAAENAASRGEINVVQQAMASVAARNKLFGEVSAQNAEIIRAKLKELSEQAVESVAIKNPAVLFNNTPKEISDATIRVGSRVSAAATLDKAIEDGKKWSTVALGFGFEFLPIAAEQGPAMDRLAIKYGVPKDAISRLDGRSQTKSYLQRAFQATPDEQKGEWLSGLYKDLKDSWLISDWQAALLIQEVATGAEQEWSGWSDWLDRLGVAGAIASGTLSLFKAGRLIKSANALNNLERTIATAGGKSAIVTAEQTKIISEVANKQRLAAVGAIAGELTGISTAIDLGKLVSVNAAKVLPDVITTAASDLQKPIRAAVDNLILELQNTIAGKGVRASEAATELENLRKFYSPVDNPRIHSLDNFVMSADGTAITGKVYYKPENATSFLTEDAAKAYINAIDPSNKMGMKVIPDTTNTGWLVEESVKKDLQLRKTALEAQILEEINNAKKAKKAATGIPLPKGDELNPPKSLVTSKPRWNTETLAFENNIDKAAYQVGSKTKLSKSDTEVKTWLQSVTGWTDRDITSHASALRNYIKENTNVLDEQGNIFVSSRVPESKPTFSAQLRFDQEFKQLQAFQNATTINNVTVSNNSQRTFIFEFVGKLGKALGLDDRKIVVLQASDVRSSSDPMLVALKDTVSKYAARGAGAIHFDYGSGQSLIVMMRDVKVSENQLGGISLRKYMEDFAHEYGHAFEAQFATKYFGIINSSFNKWLRAKNIKWVGEGINRRIDEVFSPEALLEYRSVSSAEDLMRWVERYAAGDVAEYGKVENQLHKWATLYSEFFAENFAKWAFTNEVPTTILGQAFKKLVDGIKLIITEVNNRLAQLGLQPVVGTVDKNIAAMLNVHIAQLKQAVPEAQATFEQLSKTVKKPSIDVLQRELDDVTEQLNAISDAEKGLKTGWLVEQPINRNLDYSIIGKYSDEDVNSATRFAMGDWALSTSSELYTQRLVGINQQSRYQKLLTNFVRPSIERLSKADKVALNDVLVLGDKEGKVFSEVELAGQGLSLKAREAYYKVRALRDVMWQVRNDAAVKSMIKRGFVQLNTGIKFEDGSNSVFAKPTSPKENSVVFIVDSNETQRASAKWLEEADSKGYVFYEVAEPVLIDGKYRKTLAFKKGAFDSQKIDTVIPYRAGEYRRIYSDEYFVKIRSTNEIDGVLEDVVSTHRTATNVGDANKYAKALSTARDLHKAGKLTMEEASRLMQPYGWQPEDIIKSLDEGRFGADFKVEVKFNRMDDDYINEAIGLSTNFSSKRGDKIPSVFGHDTINTVSPLDSVAAEIGNTAYVASVTEWRESNVIRWFNTFSEELPANVRTMNPDAAFLYMLNNKGQYVGLGKRGAVAEKVQDYIISQMNIPTKEEKTYLGFMKIISESIETGIGGKPILKVGAALRATKDYPTWARTISFHSFFAFNPVQFFMQGMNAFNAVAISPVHGIKSARASSLYAMALMSDQESIWRQFAKVNKLTSLGLGMDEEEFVAVISSIRRSGLLDGINTTSLYGAETGKYGISNRITRTVGNIAATPFNSGEGYSRLVSFDIARREFIGANPGVAWWTDDNLASILKRQDDLTQNMTRANTAEWQRGWKSIPTQFIQYQVKLMMNVVQSLLGNTRTFTQPEAIRLLLTHTLVMGSAGSFLWPFRDLLTGVIPEDMPEEQRLYVQQGVVAGLIGSITEGEAKLAIGSRFNTFKYYEDIVKGILDPQKSFMEVAAGPSGFAALRMLGGVGEGIRIVVKAPMTMDTLKIALSEIGKSSFSALNNVQKARLAMNNYNVVTSSSGGMMYRVTDTEAWMIGFGIPPAAQEDLSVMYESSKAHADDIKKSAKIIGKHSMLALTALRAGDDEGHRTHSAIVQAVLNTYSGSDLKQLYAEAYKVEAFTQYEKLLTDQMVKDWKIKDLIVNTGVNK